MGYLERKHLNYQILDNLVIGYGCMQLGACDRSGTPDSFDVFFDNFEDMQEWEDDTIESGYRNKYYPIYPVSIADLLTG
jgi:hypothetical protein